MGCGSSSSATADRSDAGKNSEQPGPAVEDDANGNQSRTGPEGRSGEESDEGETDGSNSSFAGPDSSDSGSGSDSDDPFAPQFDTPIMNKIWQHKSDLLDNAEQFASTSISIDAFLARFLPARLL